MGNVDAFNIIAIVLLAVIVVGIIVLFIMKKVKVSEKVMSAASLLVTLVGLLFAGVLVYIVTINMMMNLMETKQYTTFEFENEDKSAKVTIKEYRSYESTGFEIYSDDSDEMISEIPTDMYLPFSADETLLEWNGKSVVIYYTFKNTDDAYESRYITVDTSKKTVSESKKSDINLYEKRLEESGKSASDNNSSEQE